MRTIAKIHIVIMGILAVVVVCGWLEALSWKGTIAKVHRIHKGMSKDSVIQIMGQPKAINDWPLETEGVLAYYYGTPFAASDNIAVFIDANGIVRRVTDSREP